ncbi:hypothetical protein EYF80_035934 [Liparis tanakae]|uniref:Uncharacterized protein n=1 Tax=Liparis tanakae TaxID=230148 RepID=A0A4Z2GM43_9TELE|nr:hypothetical protein EYF80_035934 [Liparis tanakae]
MSLHITAGVAKQAKTSSVVVKCVLAPQAYSSPSSVSARQWLLPAMTWETGNRRVTRRNKSHGGGLATRDARRALALQAAGDSPGLGLVGCGARANLTTVVITPRKDLEGGGGSEGHGVMGAARHLSHFLVLWAGGDQQRGQPLVGVPVAQLTTASLADIPKTQACRTAASSSALSRENRGHLLTSTMAPAKPGLPRRGAAVRADAGERGGTGGGRPRAGGGDAAGGGEQEADSSLLALREGEEEN